MVPSVWRLLLLLPFDALSFFWRFLLAFLSNKISQAPPLLHFLHLPSPFMWLVITEPAARFGLYYCLLLGFRDERDFSATPEDIQSWWDFLKRTITWKLTLKGKHDNDI